MLWPSTAAPDLEPTRPLCTQLQASHVSVRMKNREKIVRLKPLSHQATFPLRWYGVV